MSITAEEIDPVCPTGYIFDKTKCECVLDTSLPPEIEPTCPEGYTFNPQLCQCEKVIIVPPPPPTGGGAFRFNEGSDFRDTPASGDNLVSDKPDLILMNGDYGVNTDTPEEWCNNTMKMIKDSGIPVWGSLGNHDDEDGYLQTGFFQNKSWSWLLKKSMIAFVAADTNSENVSETDSLLQQAQNDPTIKKIIVLMHESVFHPPNTSVSSDTTLEFHNTFKKYNKVKLVFTGHTHVYGRMNPIDGIMYLMCGIGGQSPSSGPTTPGPMHKVNGVIKCAVSEDSTIKCECVPNKGEAPGIMDTFTIGPNGELPTDGVVGERRE